VDKIDHIVISEDMVGTFYLFIVSIQQYADILELIASTVVFILSHPQLGMDINKQLCS
jgi:hypothetical protein